MEQYKYYKYKYKYLNLKYEIQLGGSNTYEKVKNHLYDLFDKNTSTDENSVFITLVQIIGLTKEDVTKIDFTNTELNFMNNIVSLFNYVKTEEEFNNLTNFIKLFTNFIYWENTYSSENLEEVTDELTFYLKKCLNNESLKINFVLLIGLFYLVKQHDLNKRFIQILNLNYIFSLDSYYRMNMMTTIFSDSKNIGKLFIDRNKDFYQLDESQKTKFKEEFKKLNTVDDMTSCFERLIDSFELISFDDYIKHVVTCLNRLPENYVLLVQIDKIVKSNEWLPLLVYVLLCIDIDFKTFCDGRYDFFSNQLTDLKKTKKPKDVILFNLYDDALLKKIAQYCATKGYNIVYCDDASYSGSQLEINIGYFESNFNVYFEKGAKLYVFVPYITDKAKKNLSCDKVIILNEGIIKNFDDTCVQNFTQILSDGLMSKINSEMSVTIFEHKLVDNISTYMHLILGSLFYYDRSKPIIDNSTQYLLKDDKNKTLIKNCDDPDPMVKVLREEEDSCMFAFYKRSLKDINYVMSISFDN